MHARCVLHASVLILAALGHAANTPTAETYCRHQLGVQTYERLSKVDQALERSLDASRDAPIGLVRPYTSGTKLGGYGKGIPLSVYRDVPRAFSQCSKVRPRSVLHITFAGSTAHWVTAGSIQGPVFGEGTNLTLASALRSIVRAVETSGNVSLPVELRLPDHAYWYKYAPEHPTHRLEEWDLSPAVHRIAARVERQYMRCGAKAPLDVAATARLVYDRGKRWSENQTFTQCLKQLRDINAASVAARPVQRCPHFLATDWFVLADGRLGRHVSRAIKSCWAQANSDPSSPVWWWLDDRALNHLVAGVHSMELALKHDKAGLRTFLEVALLARAKTCVSRNHIGSAVAEKVRMKLKKPGCLKDPDEP